MSEKRRYIILQEKLTIKVRDSARKSKRVRKEREGGKERACVKETAGEVKREKIVRQREMVGAGECVNV